MKLLRRCAEWLDEVLDLIPLPQRKDDGRWTWTSYGLGCYLGLGGLWVVDEDKRR